MELFVIAASIAIALIVRAVREGRRESLCGSKSRRIDGANGGGESRRDLGTGLQKHTKAFESDLRQLGRVCMKKLAVLHTLHGI